MYLVYVGYGCRIVEQHSHPVTVKTLCKMFQSYQGSFHLQNIDVKVVVFRPLPLNTLSLTKRTIPRKGAVAADLKTWLLDLTL